MNKVGTPEHLAESHSCLYLFDRFRHTFEKWAQGSRKWSYVGNRNVDISVGEDLLQKYRVNPLGDGE